MRLLFLCALVALTSSPLAAQRSKRGCPDTPADSVPSGMRVYQACQVDRAARLRWTAPHPNWTPSVSSIRDGSCYHADFQFVVDTVGVPEVETIRELGATDASFQQAVKDVIPRLQYEPAQLGGAPVRQIVAYHESVAVRRVVSSSGSGGAPAVRPPGC